MKAFGGLSGRSTEGNMNNRSEQGYGDNNVQIHILGGAQKIWCSLLQPIAAYYSGQFF